MSRYLVTFSVKTEGQEIKYFFLAEASSKKSALDAASDAWYAKRETEGYHKMYFKKAVALKGENEEIFSAYASNKFYKFLGQEG